MSKKKDADWLELKKDYYGVDTLVFFRNGEIDFSKDGMKSFDSLPAGLTYDDYLDAQFHSIEGEDGRGRCLSRAFFSHALLKAEGKVSVVKKGKALFKKLFITIDNAEGGAASGAEPHIWVSRSCIDDEDDLKVFDSLERDNHVSFTANVYRYFRNRKSIDFGLTDMKDFKKVSDHYIPEQTETLFSQAHKFVCDTCTFKEKCVGLMTCLMPKEEVKRKFMWFVSQTQAGHMPEVK